MSLVGRTAKRLARQSFEAKWQLEMSLFPAAAGRKRDTWADTHWPAFIDRARELLADLRADILAAPDRAALAALLDAPLATAQSTTGDD